MTLPFIYSVFIFILRIECPHVKEQSPSHPMLRMSLGLHMHVHTWTVKHMYAHTHTDTYTQAHSDTYTTYTYAHTDTYTHVHTDTQIHTDLQTDTHTCTHEDEKKYSCRAQCEVPRPLPGPHTVHTLFPQSRNTTSISTSRCPVSKAITTHTSSDSPSTHLDVKLIPFLGPPAQARSCH